MCVVQKCVSEYFEAANAIAGGIFVKIKDESVRKKKDVLVMLRDVVLINIG